jgi:hypothetical protein
MKGNFSREWEREKKINRLIELKITINLKSSFIKEIKNLYLPFCINVSRDELGMVF